MAWHKDIISALLDLPERRVAVASSAHGKVLLTTFVARDDAPEAVELGIPVRLTPAEALALARDLRMAADEAASAEESRP